MTDHKPTTLETARDAAASAVDTARDNAREAARATSQSIEGNPMSVLVGGIALGVLAGAFLPKTKRETELLAPVGRRITDTAKAAALAARDAGKSELDTLGLNKGGAQNQMKTLLSGVFQAVVTAAGAGGAAAQTAGKK